MSARNRQARDADVERLYAAETAALERAEGALTRQQLSSATYEPFRELIRHYRRLLRHSMKITAVSDSTQLQLRNTTRQLATALAKVELLNTELQALQQEKDEIFAMAVHDLRSPLSGICGLATLLAEQDSLTPQETAEMGGLISNIGEGMLTMVGDLVELYRLETMQRPFVASTLTLAGLRDDLEEMLGPVARRKHSKLVFKLGRPAETVTIAAEQFMRITGNLVSNALKYSPPGSTVAVTISVDGANLRFAVADEGPGISIADQKKLFHKFTRLSARPTGGEASSGLGLAIVKRLVDQMQGKVWCESVLGEGATFHVVLPRHAAPAT